MNVALRVSTPLTVGVFVVSAVTGVMLFFHLGERLVKGLHEWIGLAFVAFALLHVLRNWRALVGYARKPALWVACAASLVAAAGFIVPALGAKEGGGGDAQRRLTQVVMGAPIEQVAPLLATTVPALTERLTTAGFTVEGGARSLNEIARESGRSPRELVEVVVAGLPPAPAGGPGGR